MTLELSSPLHPDFHFLLSLRIRTEPVSSHLTFAKCNTGNFSMAETNYTLMEAVSSLDGRSTKSSLHPCQAIVLQGLSVLRPAMST